MTIKIACERVRECRQRLREFLPVDPREHFGRLHFKPARPDLHPCALLDRPARAAAAGPITASALNHSCSCTRAPLPGYPFNPHLCRTCALKAHHNGNIPYTYIGVCVLRFTVALKCKTEWQIVITANKKEDIYLTKNNGDGLDCSSRLFLPCNMEVQSVIPQISKCPVYQ